MARRRRREVIHTEEELDEIQHDLELKFRNAIVGDRQKILRTDLLAAIDNAFCELAETSNVISFSEIKRRGTAIRASSENQSLQATPRLAAQ